VRLQQLVQRALHLARAEPALVHQERDVRAHRRVEDRGREGGAAGAGGREARRLARGLRRKRGWNETQFINII
jgi:hypothetical protein